MKFNFRFQENPKAHSYDKLIVKLRFDSKVTLEIFKITHLGYKPSFDYRANEKSRMSVFIRETLSTSLSQFRFELLVILKTSQSVIRKIVSQSILSGKRNVKVPLFQTTYSLLV